MQEETLTAQNREFLLIIRLMSENLWSHEAVGATLACQTVPRAQRYQYRGSMQWVLNAQRRT